MVSTAYKATLNAVGGVSSDDEDADKERMASMVWLWDTGPERPVQPPKPAAPAGKEGDPAFEMKALDHRFALEDYAAAMAVFRRQSQEFDDWRRKSDGPVLLFMWSVDAKTAMAYDREAVKDGRQKNLRYHVSSRTRGYAQLPNMGLPDGTTTGRGYEEQMRRERDGEADIALARKRDPIFGGQAA